MKLNSLVLVLALFFVEGLFANDNFLPLPIINRGDKILDLTTKNLEVSNTAKHSVAELKGDIRWERSKEYILLPFVKIRLKVQSEQNVHLYYRYKNVTYLPQVKNGEEFTDIDLSIFDPTKIEVFDDANKVGEVGIHSFSLGENKSVLLDYSCSGYNLQVSGIESEFLSIGCEIVRENVKGEIIPSLKVHWISSDYKTLDQRSGPYVISFSEGREAKVRVVNEKDEKKEILFKVDFPTRLHRLRTSIGLGPYVYETSKGSLEKEAEVLPSFMLYGNYYLNNIHSFKFFEALVMKETVFNHAGLYVGSDLGKFYDDRLVISSLIGLQALSHRYDVGEDELFTQIIFPQGLELAMHHPFGMENYRFTVGGFVSPQSNVTYQNFWARFGARMFVEFNYINWAYGSRASTMYGLSLGFPFLQF